MMRIGYVTSDTPGLVDRVLAEVADRAMAAGLALAGAIAEPAAASQGCRIVLRVLPAGPVRDVSLGPDAGATACRLDAGALEGLALEVLAGLPDAQALIANKFGKQEAAGRGLVGAMGMACERGIPVLLGVAPEWRPAFLAFVEDQAEALSADPDLVFGWLATGVAASVPPPPAPPARG
jgi:hypothetical protein